MYLARNQGPEFSKSLMSYFVLKAVGTSRCNSTLSIYLSIYILLFIYSCIYSTIPLIDHEGHTCQIVVFHLSLFIMFSVYVLFACPVKYLCCINLCWSTTQYRGDHLEIEWTIQHKSILYNSDTLLQSIGMTSHKHLNTQQILTFVMTTKRKVN